MGHLEVKDNNYFVDSSIRLEFPVFKNLKFSDNTEKLDADSTSIVIKDSNGDKKVDSVLTKNADGEYYFIWDTEGLNAQKYLVKAKVEKGQNTGREKYFIVLRNTDS